MSHGMNHTPRVDDITAMLNARDVDGIRWELMAAWAGWRGTMRQVKADGTDRDLYRRAYRLETRIDRLTRAADYMETAEA